MEELSRSVRERRSPKIVVALLGPSFALLWLGMLTGCGAGTAARTSDAGLTITGHVRGGQQPVSGALLQLWAAGQNGNGSAATPLVPTGEYYLGGSSGCVPSSTQTCYPGVYTDAGGGFTLTGDYKCPSATAQTYITVQGGNPGLASGTDNPELLMVDLLGSCSNLSPSTDILIDEVTTAAAIWAVSPFMDLNGNIGSSPTNSIGLANAFLNSQLLANSADGNPPNLGPNLTIETGKLYTLANVLGACINSTGSSGCQALFTEATPPGGTPPTNSLAAGLDIVRNPSNNVAAIFYSASPQPPFPSTLSSPPNDWTMSLTISGGGLYYPSALGVDGFGNVWVGNYYGVLSGFSPQGTAFSSTGYNISGGDEVYGLTIDTSNDIWVSNEELPYHGNAGSVTRLNGAASGSAMGTYVNGTQFLYGNYVDFPIGLAADTNGNVLVANYADASASVFNSSGVDIQDGIGYGNAAFPVAVTADPSHGIWLANQGDGTVTHLDGNGNLLARVACCNGANGIATDAYGNAWVANYYGSSVSEVSNANAVLLAGDQQGGISYPAAVVVDAGQNIWVVNYRGQSFSEIAGNANILAAGTGISPSTGYGRDASLLEPYGIALDASGNVWLSNFSASKLTMFFGMATPTATPTMPVPTAP
jgi:sugar lactone lactonase YvrE